MNVLSLFDGMSGGQIALDRIGIKPMKYYASEIDTYAIAVTQYNYPNTIQLGDINNWESWDIEWQSIDLILAGSPCQGLSQSGKGGGLTDERSALFFVFIDILEFVKQKNPNIKFLLENVVPKKKQWADNITEIIEVEPLKIDSALLSAQSRKRLYWTNIQNVEQPEDKEIYLEDIIESVQPDSMKSYCIDASYFKGGNLKQYFEKARRQLVFDSPVQVGHINQNHRGSRVYATNGKSVTLTANGGGWGMKTGLYIDIPISYSRKDGSSGNDLSKIFPLESSNWRGLNRNQRQTAIARMIENGDFVIRKLSPVECERLQTINDNHTASGLFNGEIKKISDTQRYKMLGNGWTVDVIAHILKHEYGEHYVDGI